MIAVRYIYWFRRAAEQGQGHAQLLLAYAYENGTGVPVDKVKAVGWWHKVIEQGNADPEISIDAITKLAGAYGKGEGVKRDFVESARWWRIGAERGNLGCQNMLGIYYRDGVGVEKDPVQAMRWFRMAADQGNATAQFELGKILFDEGQTQNFPEAARWFRKAAEQGKAEAQTILGMAYESGIGVDQDQAEAARWFGAAAAQGDVAAKQKLKPKGKTGKKLIVAAVMLAVLTFVVSKTINYEGTPHASRVSDNAAPGSDVVSPTPNIRFVAPPPNNTTPGPYIPPMTPSAHRGDLGIKVAVINDFTRRQYHLSANQKGVVVVDVAAGGTAMRRGLTPGDVIVAVNDVKVNSPADAIAELNKATLSGRDRVVLLIQSVYGLHREPLLL